MLNDLENGLSQDMFTSPTKNKEKNGEGEVTDLYNSNNDGSGGKKDLNNEDKCNNNKLILKTNTTMNSSTDCYMKRNRSKLTPSPTTLREVLRKKLRIYPKKI